VRRTFRFLERTVRRASALHRRIVAPAHRRIIASSIDGQLRRLQRRLQTAFVITQSTL